MASYRLPTNVKPLHYDITLKTSLEKRSFEGTSSILLQVETPTEKHLTFNVHPTLNVHSLSLSSTSIKTEDSFQIPDSAVQREDKEERVTVDLSKLDGFNWKEGDQVTLNLGWGADFGQGMNGYYISTYTDKDTKKDAIYTLTQFEATDARRAMPCWDEPALKASFEVTMISQADTVSLSNMPAVDERPWVEDESKEVQGKTVGKLMKTEVGKEGGKWKVTKFAKSPKMSTYLLAFANGKFEHREDSYVSPLTGKTIPLRLYATSDIIHQVDYALEVTKRATPLYEEIFDIPYALPKLDSLVASDFDAGAMENYGLITGRTSVLLLDEKSGLAAKKRVASVQSHEIAHQWFGNYVTMDWWSALWLNEAFATLCGEVIIPDRLYPEWKVRSSFISDHLFRAFDLDAQRSSHPIEVECKDANKINEIFDAISYSKGGSVLRMISEIVGEDKFLKGVSTYLKAHAYGNATTQDLWKGIQEASGVDIPKIADAWTQKIGYPVVTATQNGDKLHLKQNRFLATGDVKPEEDETIWHIPLRLILVKDGKVEIKKDLVLSERETTVDLEGATLYKLNAGTTGFYRVAYSSAHLDALGKESSKKNSVLSPEDRVGLVADAYNLSRAGYSPTSGMLDLISHFKNEEAKVVWTSVAEALGDLSSVWWEQPKTIQDSLKDLTRTIFAPLIDRLGFEFHESEDPDVKELRTLAFGQAGAAGYQPVIDFATESFQKFAKGDENVIAPDFQRSIFRLAVKHIGEDAYNKVKEIYAHPANPSTKIDAMVALTASDDEKLLKRTFDMLATEVKDQDVMLFFSGLAQNIKSRRALVDYFQDNYDVLFKRFEGTQSLPRLVKIAYGNLSSDADLASIQTFYTAKDTTRYEMSLSQVKESILASAQWLKKDEKDVESWLQARK